MNWIKYNLEKYIKDHRTYTTVGILMKGYMKDVMPEAGPLELCVYYGKTIPDISYEFFTAGAQYVRSGFCLIQLCNIRHLISMSKSRLDYMRKSRAYTNIHTGKHGVMYDSQQF